MAFYSGVVTFPSLHSPFNVRSWKSIVSAFHSPANFTLQSLILICSKNCCTSATQRSQTMKRSSMQLPYQMIASSHRLCTEKIQLYSHQAINKLANDRENFYPIGHLQSLNTIFYQNLNNCVLKEINTHQQKFLKVQCEGAVPPQAVRYCNTSLVMENAIIQTHNIQGDPSIVLKPIKIEENFQNFLRIFKVTRFPLY